MNHLFTLFMVINKLLFFFEGAQLICFLFDVKYVLPMVSCITLQPNDI